MCFLVFISVPPKRWNKQKAYTATLGLAFQISKHIADHTLCNARPIKLRHKGNGFLYFFSRHLKDKEGGFQENADLALHGEVYIAGYRKVIAHDPAVEISLS